MPVYGEGNGPLGTTMGMGTFEIFFGDADAYGAAARPHLQKLLQQRHHVMQQIAHAKKAGKFKGAHAKQLKKHLAAINAQIAKLKKGGKGKHHIRRMGSQRRRMPMRPFRSMMPGRGQSLMQQTAMPQLAPPGAIPRLPDTAAQQDPFFYPPTGPGGEGMFDPGAGPEPSAYPYSVEAEPGFNQLVPLDDVDAGEDDMNGFYGGWGGAWAQGPIPTAPVAAFTAAERAGFGDVLFGEGEGIFGAIGDLLEGIGDAIGLDGIGDMLVGDMDFGGDDYGKVDPKVLARIEHLKARKKALKAAIKSASGAKKDRLQAELQQVKHALKLARNLRAAQRGAAGKIAAAALGPAGLLASRGGIFRSKKKAARKEAAARHALAKMERDGRVVSRRVMYPHRKALPWWLARRRQQQRWVPPGYPPVPGYPFAPPPPPGQVPGTYMVPGTSANLPPMPAGGPGYMNQTAMGPGPGDDSDAGPGGDDDDGDGKGGLIKIGIGVLVVGGIAYAVTHAKKGRGPKLSKAERRARRAGMGGPP